MKRNYNFAFACVLVFLFSACTTIPKTSNPDEFVYKDAGGKYHIARINPDVDKVQYDKNLFKLKKHKMTYHDKEKYTCRWGIDISRHEGEIDWQKVRDFGIEFVIIRIGWRGYQTGILHLDENFHRNLLQKNKVLLLGLHHKFFQQKWNLPLNRA